MDPMALARAKATETTNTLITADNKYIQNISSSQIFSAGLRNQNLLLEKIANLAIANDLVGADDRETFKQNVQVNKDLVDSITLQTHYSNRDDEGLQSFSDTEGLLVPLYTEGNDPLTNSVSDTQLKNIDFLSCEEHHGPDLDVHIETFLTTVFNVAKQLNLSHTCCCNVIQRKLTHTAKNIFHSWLDSNDLQADRVTLGQLCNFLEKTFCLFSTEKAISQQLISLPKIQNGRYLISIAKISRLCRLSVRHVQDKPQRDLLQSSREIETFRTVISDSDKAFLMGEDRKRQEQHKLPLNIHKSGQILAQRYADSLQNINDSSTLSSNAAQISPEDDNNYEDDDYHVNYAPRGRGRFQRGQQRGRSRKNYTNYQPPQKYQAPQQKYPPPQRFPPPAGRGRGLSRGRNNYQPNRGRGGRGGRLPQPGKKAPEKRPNITNESLGIQHNHCILCNEAGCRPFYTNCRYFGRTQIYSTNCGNCLAQGKLGAHSERSCLEPRVKKGYHASPDDDDRSSIASFLAKFPKN